jgi:hypothetical protein
MAASLLDKSIQLADKVSRGEMKPPMRRKFLEVNRRIDFSRIKLLVWDINKTLSADHRFYTPMVAASIFSMARAIDDSKARAKFLKGVAQLNTPETI